MKTMKKGDITRVVTDKEAVFLKGHGYSEVTEEKKALGTPKKEGKKLTDSSLGEGAK